MTKEYNFADDPLHPSPVRIVVFGLGGGGGNAVDAMVRAKISGAEFYVGNTDLQALNKNCCPNKMQLGQKLTKGRGAGGKPEKGKESAIESAEEIKEKVLKGTDMLFIIAGMGGGTGMGASPVVAQLAKDLNILTIAVVTTPFEHEGNLRFKRAEKGLMELEELVDSVVVIPNQKLVISAGEEMTYLDAMALSDHVLRDVLHAIVTVIHSNATVNLDFADIQSVFEDRGRAFIGIGHSSGKNSAIEAAKSAIYSPLLENAEALCYAKGGIIFARCGPGVTMDQFSKATAHIKSVFVDLDKVNIFVGQTTEMDYGDDEIEIIVIFNGFGRPEECPPMQPQMVGHPTGRPAIDNRALGIFNAVPAAPLPNPSAPPPTPNMRNSEQVRQSLASLRASSQHPIVKSNDEETQSSGFKRSSRFRRGTPENEERRRRFTDRNINMLEMPNAPESMQSLSFLRDNHPAKSVPPENPDDHQK